MEVADFAACEGIDETGAERLEEFFFTPDAAEVENLGLSIGGREEPAAGTQGRRRTGSVSVSVAIRVPRARTPSE